jgi:hypothetical protein
MPIYYTYWKLNHLCFPFVETMNMYVPTDKGFKAAVISVVVLGNI